MIPEDEIPVDVGVGIPTTSLAAFVGGNQFLFSLCHECSGLIMSAHPAAAPSAMSGLGWRHVHDVMIFIEDSHGDVRIHHADAHR